jgi:tetratricopeptide (TPR) repeat protein
MTSQFVVRTGRVVVGVALMLGASAGISILQQSVTLAMENVYVAQVSAQNLYEQGVEQAATERYDAAVESFTQAIALEPSFAQAYSARGRAYVLAGDRRSAFQDLEQSSRLHMDQDQLEEALSDMNLMIDLLEMGIRQRGDRLN